MARRRARSQKIPPMAYVAAALAFYVFVLRPKRVAAALPPSSAAPAPALVAPPVNYSDYPDNL